MKSKCSPKKDNPVNAPAIGANVNQTSVASLKDNEKMRHGETMPPHLGPQHRKEELTIALAVIRKVMSMEVAEPFNVPVNPIMLGITDYFDVIDTPMDFGTIRRNLENGVKYMNADDVFSDVQYIWENCYKYNKPGDPFLELVKQVKETFIMFWNAVGLHSNKPRMATGHTPSLPPKDTPKRRSPRFSEGPMARSPQDHSSHSQPQPQPQSHLSHKRLKSAQPSSSQPHQLQQSSKETQASLSLKGEGTDSLSPPSRQKQTKGEGSSSSRKRARGPTCYIKLLRLRPGERITPQWSEDGELIQQEKGKKLTSYLGTLVRCQRNAPLQVKDWSQVPNEAKQKLWGLVLEKFDIDDEHRDYVMSSMGSKYRSYRYKMKAKYYDPYITDEVHLSNCPPDVSQDDWRWLVHYWGTPEVQAVSERNKANRSKHVIRHTSGSKSHAQIRYEQAQMRKDGKMPNQIEMFVLTHTRKDGTPVDNESRDIMTQFEELLAQQAGRSPPPVDALYAQVMGRHGRVRGFGLGPTRSRASVRALVKEFAFVKEQLASVNQQLEEQRKELEEMALQKQRMQEEVQEWMEEQLVKMKDEMMQQLQQHMQQFQQRLRLVKIQLKPKE